MTIEEFVKSIDFPEMKLLGTMKNFRYYIRDIPKDELDNEIGEPIVIEENLVSNTFKVCDSKQTFAIIEYFSKEE